MPFCNLACSKLRQYGEVGLDIPCVDLQGVGWACIYHNLQNLRRDFSHSKFE